ncbi:hypothetical protein WJX82_007959 [Trebouxia sp. C0006]
MVIVAVSGDIKLTPATWPPDGVTVPAGRRVTVIKGDNFGGSAIDFGGIASAIKVQNGGWLKLSGLALRNPAPARWTTINDTYIVNTALAALPSIDIEPNATVVYSNVSAQYYSAYASNNPSQYTLRVLYGIEQLGVNVPPLASQTDNTTIMWIGPTLLELPASAHVTGAANTFQLTVTDSTAMCMATPIATLSGSHFASMQSTNKPEMSPGEVELGPLLGRGAYGRVFKGRWGEGDQSERVSCASECDTSATPQPAVIDDAMHTANAKDEMQTWILLEYCDRGSIEMACVQNRFTNRLDGKANMVNLYKSLQDIAAGMDYLHSLGVLHGDLKGANVLLKSTATDSRGFICKLADFGLSCVLDLDMTHISTHTHGTISYMPPEVLSHGKMTRAADTYSFGMLMWEMQRPAIPEDCPDAFVTLMTSCWSADPLQRPTFGQIIKDLQLLRPPPAAPPCMTGVGDLKEPSAGQFDFTLSCEANKLRVRPILSHTLVYCTDDEF